MYGLGATFKVMIFGGGIAAILLWFLILYWHKKETNSEIHPLVYWIPVVIILIIILYKVQGISGN